MKQFPHRDDGIVHRHGSGSVDRTVAESVDDASLAEDRIAGGLFERGLVNQRGDVVRVGQLQGCVVLECPVDSQFKCAPRVAAGRSRISVDKSFSPAGRIGGFGPLLAQEGELTHKVAP